MIIVYVADISKGSHRELTMVELRLHHVHRRFGVMFMTHPKVDAMSSANRHNILEKPRAETLDARCFAENFEIQQKGRPLERPLEGDMHVYTKHKDSQEMTFARLEGFR